MKRILILLVALMATSVSALNITNLVQTNAAALSWFVPLVDIAGTNMFNVSVSNLLTKQPKLGATDLVATNTVTATNGFVLIQAAAIPTNSVPPSSASVTNWLLLVNTNGAPSLVATNVNDTPAGQAFFVKPLWP